MYSSNDTFTIMTSTVHTIGTYLMLDANTIHKKRGCNSLRFYRILVTAPFLYHSLIRYGLWLLNPYHGYDVLSFMNSTYDISDAV